MLLDIEDKNINDLSLKMRRKYRFVWNWDNTPLFVKYNPGLLDLLVLLDETGLQTGL